MVIQDIISIIVVLVILATVIYILLKTNKKLRERMIYEKYKFLIYKKRLEEIKDIKDNNQILKRINKLSKAFFKEKFNFRNDMTYLELAEKFKKANKKNYEEYCSFMSNWIYSGKEITSKDINKLIDSLSGLIESD